MLEYNIRKIKPCQLNKLSKILVKVYFKTFTDKQLGYPSALRYKYLLKLRDLKKYLKKIGCEIYVAVSDEDKILGGVFYYKNLEGYGLNIKLKSNKTSAIRYLAVDSKYKGIGVGKTLVEECLKLSKNDKNKKLVLHTLDTMKEAMFMYEKYGFKRYKKIDFNIGKIEVKGYITKIK